MKFELTTYTKTGKAPSAEIVQAVTALVEATTKDENAALTLVFDAKEEAKELRAFRQAAKDQGKTVRVRTRDDSGLTKIGQKENGKAIYQGEVTVVVSLADKYADGRGRPKGSGKDAETEAKPSK